ncbi:hypothetical protein I4U23_010579 [Adineta vaga]|nr:hypothetical protein I4U23_010579 [Adineta vaga]
MTKVSFFVSISIWCLFCQFAQANEQCPAGFQCAKSMKASSIKSNDEYELILIPCPPGTASELGQYGCAPCELGYYANASGTASCSVCPIGAMCADAAKSPAPCPLGTYVSCTGQTFCSPCALGTYTPSVGSTHCIDCPVGAMCPDATKSPTPCPRGTYASCTGQACCSPCALGTYTPNAGSIHCIKCPPGVQCPKSPTTACDGDLLSTKHRNILSEFAGKKDLKWILLYKATRDGFGGADFHRLCDGHAQTMSIIQSKQRFLFGGYANRAWNSSSSWINDPRAFIFTLTNPNNILPTRYLIQGGKEQHAYIVNPLYGPIFGAGLDISVVDKSNVTDCTINFPSTYTDTTGKGKATFTGNSTFQTSEIEVYKLLD